MGEEKRAELRRGEQPFTNADEKGFERGGIRVSRATTGGWSGFPALNNGPIERGEKGARAGDKGILFEPFGKGRLVKDVRSRYQSMGLLLLVEVLVLNTLQMEFLLCQGRSPDISGKSGGVEGGIPCSSERRKAETMGNRGFS
jgi:hypothetical protein